MSLEIRETFVNESKGYQFGETDWYEPYTDDRGALFRSLRKEYGACVSKVYREPTETACGWVFRKRMEYEDYRGRGERYYTRKVWVQYRDLHQQALACDLTRSVSF